MNVDRYASLSGCKSAQLPISYMGLPIGAYISRLIGWNSIIEKFIKKKTLRKLVYCRLEANLHYRNRFWVPWGYASRLDFGWRGCRYIFGISDS